MKYNLLKSQLVIYFLVLLPAFLLAQGQENAMREAYDLGLILNLIKLLAIVSFVALVIFRNKRAAVFSLICGVALVIGGTGKVSRFLLTDAVAVIYVISGFLLINFSVILGWIYQKQSCTSKDPISAKNETLWPENNKALMSLNSTFLTFVLMGIYNTLVFYYDPSLIHTPVSPMLNYIAPLIFLCLILWLFFKKIRMGWIMGCGFLVSNVLFSFINMLYYFKMYGLNSWQEWLLIFVSNFIFLGCQIIFLLLCLSGSVREEFKIQKRHLVSAILIGVVLSFYHLYLIHYLNAMFAKPTI